MNRFVLSGQTVQLLPEGAAFLPDRGTLVLADIHLGKAAAFRARGLPVPEGDNARDLHRILRLCRDTAARQLVIAGDLLHAPAGLDADLEALLARFFEEAAISIVLIRGNHEEKFATLPPFLSPLPHFDLDGIRIVHDPAHASPAPLHLAGHWHPVVRIPDGKRTALRLPCFLFRGNTLVLPSFGGFTGGAILSREPGDRIFVALREQVVELPG